MNELPYKMLIECDLMQMNKYIDENSPWHPYNPMEVQYVDRTAKTKQSMHDLIGASNDDATNGPGWDNT